MNPVLVKLARHAMATRFEVALHGKDESALRAAGEESLAEIERVERMLSLYRESSEVANVNARAAAEPVRVSFELFQLLKEARRLSAATDGAFDLTIAPLVKCWGFMRGDGEAPSDEAIAQARRRVGWQLLELDEASRSVRFGREGMMLDFGAFGKGYALDRAAEILRESGVASALIHGGTSTVIGIGAGPWRIAVEAEPRGAFSEEGTKPVVVAVAELRDEALSVSAVWGKSFASQGKSFGHILDARTGRPSESAELAAVICQSAAESDALSTALLVDGPSALGRWGKRALAHARGQTRLWNWSAHAA